MKLYKKVLIGMYLISWVAMATILALIFLVALSGCGLQDQGFTVVQPEVAPVPAPAVTTAPAAALQCPTGGSDITLTIGSAQQTVTLCNGSMGPSGATGQTGNTGPQGVPGINADPITFIQFCPNVTPNYPVTFPEYGIVQDGKVYGVYSANDGFLAYLPPGLYQSNAIGNSCTFTINADGSISY